MSYKTAKKFKNRNRTASIDDSGLPSQRSLLKKKTTKTLQSKDELHSLDIGLGNARSSKSDLQLMLHDAKKNKRPQTEIDRLQRAIGSYDNSAVNLQKEAYLRRQQHLKKQPVTSKTIGKVDDSVVDIFFRKQGKVATSPKELQAFKNALETRGPISKTIEQEFKAKFGSATQKLDLDQEGDNLYQNSEDFRNAVATLTAAIENGDWVFMNDKHIGTKAFALVHYVMKKTNGKGKVLLEAPYALNWDNDLVGGLMTYAKDYGVIGGPGAALTAKAALKMGWTPITMDVLDVNSSNVSEPTLTESKIQGFDDEKSGLHPMGNYPRQNYIARNVHYEMQDSKLKGTGGILIYGGAHLMGADISHELPMQNMITTNPYSTAQQIRLADGDDSSDYFALVIPKETVADEPTYSKRPANNTIGLRDSDYTRLLKAQKNLINRKAAVKADNSSNGKKVPSYVKRNHLKFLKSATEELNKMLQEEVFSGLTADQLDTANQQAILEVQKAAREKAERDRLLEAQRAKARLKSKKKKKKKSKKTNKQLNANANVTPTIDALTQPLTNTVTTTDSTVII